MPSLEKTKSISFPRQINQATSFIDASPLYGNSREEAVPLRLFQKGELLADHELHKGGVAPRMASGAPRACQGQLCFLAGTRLFYIHTYIHRMIHRMTGNI